MPVMLQAMWSAFFLLKIIRWMLAFDTQWNFSSKRPVSEVLNRTGWAWAVGARGAISTGGGWSVEADGVATGTPKAVDEGMRQHHPGQHTPRARAGRIRRVLHAYSSMLSMESGWSP